MQEADLLALRNFISTKRPHAIVIGGESRDAMMVAGDLREIVSNLVEDDQFPQIPVEIMDNELAKVYANSIKGEVRKDNSCVGWVIIWLAKATQACKNKIIQETKFSLVL